MPRTSLFLTPLKFPAHTAALPTGRHHSSRSASLVEEVKTHHLSSAVCLCWRSVWTIVNSIDLKLNLCNQLNLILPRDLVSAIPPSSRLEPGTSMTNLHDLTAHAAVCISPVRLGDPLSPRLHCGHRSHHCVINGKLEARKAVSPA